MHKLLRRQLKKYTNAHGQLNCEGLLDAINASYTQFDSDDERNNFILHVMSKEMTEKNEIINQHKNNLEQEILQRTEELRLAKEDAEEANRMPSMTKIVLCRYSSIYFQTPLNSALLAVTFNALSN